MNVLQQLRLRLGLPVYLEHVRLPGWSGPLPFYAFKCPLHGLVVDYPHGHAGVLTCPKCLNNTNTTIGAMKKIKCSRCGYEWETLGKHLWVTCPNCMTKTKVGE